MASVLVANMLVTTVRCSARNSWKGLKTPRMPFKTTYALNECAVMDAGNDPVPVVVSKELRPPVITIATTCKGAVKIQASIVPRQAANCPVRSTLAHTSLRRPDMSDAGISPWNRRASMTGDTLRNKSCGTDMAPSTKAVCKGVVAAVPASAEQSRYNYAY